MDVDASVLVNVFNPSRLVFAILVLVGAVFLTRGISGFLDRIGERQARRRLMLKRISTIARFVIFLLSAVVIVSNVFTLNRDALLALGGTIAVTVGFALKDTAASIISGILILIDQPFQVGDRITFGDTYGEVKEIGLRSVRIETLDDNLVSIPTNKFLTEAVSSGNAGALDMQIVIDFHVAVDSDFDRARRICYEAAVTSKYVFLNKPVIVAISDVVTPVAFATRLRVKVYVFDVRYETKIVSDIMERTKRQFAREGIRPPFVVERHDLGAAAA